jgi:L-histidine Nalpha-methyltransferase
MNSLTSDTIERPDASAEVDAFADAVIAGLERSQKQLPTRYLYDARGSELFERITALDEYYPTRTEIGILRVAAPEWTAALSRGTLLVEFGSGSSVKTELLLAATPNIATYLPIDVSVAALEDARRRLARRFPDLEVVPLVADFNAARIPERLGDRPRAGFFPGSTIGNFEPVEATALLRTFARVLGVGSRLLIGADLQKSRDILERAYDDREGVTAAFNLNLLRRIERELGARLDRDAFRHRAVYNEEHGRIEMYLVATHRQRIVVRGRTFDLAAGEQIHTESSHKYTVESFRALAAHAGWRAVDVWTDADGMFSVHALEVDAT